MKYALVWVGPKERLRDMPKLENPLLWTLHRNRPRWIERSSSNTVFLLSEYQSSDGLDGVESLITNVGGRLLMLQKDKAYPERKSKKVSVMWGAVASWLCTLLRIEQSGFKPWPGTLCCVLGPDTILPVPLSTQVYKWVPAKLMLRVTLLNSKPWILTRIEPVTFVIPVQTLCLCLTKSK